MGSKQTIKDLDDQIAKLEAKLNELMEQAQKNPPPPQPQKQTSSSTTSSQQEQNQSPSSTTSSPPQQNVQQSSTSSYDKSRQQILEEYEKGYLERLEKRKREDQEMQRAMAELQAKKTAGQAGSQAGLKRGAMPKGF